MQQPKSQRQLQVSEQIKRIIADIFLREGLSTIMGSFITVLEADVSPDIKNVKIYLDIFGDQKNNKKILDKFNDMSPFFRHNLGKKMASRNTPEIRFVLDDTQQKAINIESLIASEAIAIAEPSSVRKAKTTKKTVKKETVKKVTKKTTKK